MSVFDSFKPKRLVTGSPFVSVTKNGVTFTKSAVDKLGYPEYVVILIDEESHRMGIKPAIESNEDATLFVKNGDKKVPNVRWNNGEFTKELTAWVKDPEYKEKGFKVYGEYLPEEQALLFDFEKAQEI